jgi:hypothetical protein
MSATYEMHGELVRVIPDYGKNEMFDWVRLQWAIDKVTSYLWDDPSWPTGVKDLANYQGAMAYMREHLTVGQVMA